MTRKTAIEAIFDRMNVAKSGCWEVFGYADRDGYAKVGSKGKAHRIAYEHFIGSAKGLLVCHSCDNPRCVNPEHLWLGTSAQNTADRNAKRRQARGSKIRPSISVEKATQLRNEYLAGSASQAEIALKYGVSSAQVSLLSRGLTWHFRSAA